MVARLPRWLFLIALALFASGCSEPDPLAGAPKPKPLILIALDGMEWSVVQPLLARGKMPNLAKELESGTYGKLRTVTPTLSPILWTTVVTGKKPEEHGITGFTRQDENGDEVLYTNIDRKTKALWNILSDYDLRVASIGWWMTYPAEKINGLMVAQTNTNDDTRRLLKGTLKEGVPDQVYPPDRQEDVLARVSRIKERSDKLKRRVFGHLPNTQKGLKRALVQRIEWSVEADTLYHGIAKESLGEKPGYDLTLLYLGGTDVLGHRFWKYMRPNLYEERPRQDRVVAFREVIPKYYVYVDEMIGEIRSAAPEANLIMMSEHGMVPVFGDARFSAHHQQGPPGFFACSGPEFKKTHDLASWEDLKHTELPEVATIYDITRTILAHFRLPQGKDMQGRVLTDLYQPEYQIELQPDPIATHDDDAFRRTREKDGSGPDRRDLERLEQLRSLGYLGDDEEELEEEAAEAAESDTEPDTPAPGGG